MKPSSRIAGIDIARGLAIYLMFQSHTIKGLLFFRDMPDWGVHPMHTITKFSSSLFVIVFGLTLGVIFAPRTLREDWAHSRNHLWWRSLIVLFWYKVLIVAQTFQSRPRDVIVDMLLYKKFPDFVEILDFYAWMLLVIPLLLPLWRKVPVWVGPLFALALFGLGQWLSANWNFFDLPQLKAILVEDKRNFCFGILTRGPLAMLGIFLGDLIARAEDRAVRRRMVAGLCILAGLALLIVFYASFGDQLDKVFVDIARNRGKHPPALFFMSFSVGGSLIILGLCLLLPSGGFFLLKPFEILGRESLVCFVWHILAVFIGLRWALDLKRVNRTPQVTYTQALLLTGLVTVTAIGVAQLNTWRKRWQAERRREQGTLEALVESPDTEPDARAPRRDALAQPAAVDEDHDAIIKELLR
ncbi:MAG: OpgC domain-containing protein [Pseudomonadota bacterium]